MSGGRECGFDGAGAPAFINSEGLMWNDASRARTPPVAISLRLDGSIPSSALPAPAPRTRRSARPPCKNPKCGHPKDEHWAFEDDCVWAGCECKRFQ